MARRRTKPPSQRQLRVGEEIRHALADIFERETFRDPSLAGVTLTVTEVEASPDLRRATAYVVRLGGGDMTEVLAGLGRVKSFLRRELSHRLRLKFVPDLSFTADVSFDEASRLDSLLHRPEVARDLTHGDQDDTDDEDGP